MRTPEDDGDRDFAVPEHEPNQPFPEREAEGDLSGVLDLELAGEIAAAIAPSCAPPPDLFAEIERRLEAGRVQVWKSWEPVAADELAPGILTVRADRDDLWERTDCPGVLVKRLHVDPAARRVTMLVRMAAGSSYPGHRHAAREECLVLEGSLRVGTCRLERGDYQVATRGSAHLEQATDEGCLLLISSSMDDELHAR